MKLPNVVGMRYFRGMTVDERYMQRCIELARNGAGSVSPNPMVGCVVVLGDRIVAEGWHQYYGGPHAEVNALQQIQDPNILAQSTVYVSLEPCSHFGKTPPCADLLIRSQVKKVVVGMVDPFKEVSGTGIQRLRDAGIEVVVGVLEDQCRELNKRFITFHQQQRPYIFLKWAQTLDGYMAPDATLLTPEQYAVERLITGPEEQLLVHKWRGEEDAVLVGRRTALLDNPALNTRAYPGRNPIRIVIDNEGKLPPDLKLFDGTQPTLVYTQDVTPMARPNITSIELNGESSNIWKQIMDDLYKRNIQSVVVEGGAHTLTSLIQSNIWDEMQVFEADRLLNGGVKAPGVQGKQMGRTQLAHSTLTICRNL